MTEANVNYALRAVPDVVRKGVFQPGRAWIALDSDKGRVLGISGHRIHAVHVPNLERADQRLTVVGLAELKQLAKTNTRKSWAAAIDADPRYEGITKSAINILDSPEASSFAVTTVGEIRDALEERLAIQDKDTTMPISLLELTADGELLLNGIEIGSSMGKLPASRALDSKYLKSVLIGNGDTQVGIGMKHGSTSDIGTRRWRGWQPIRFQLLDTPYTALVSPIRYP